MLLGEIQKALFYGTENIGGEYASITTLLPTGVGTSASHLTATQEKYLKMVSPQLLRYLVV